MLTEEKDARFAWCPMARVYDPNTKVSGFNIILEGPSHEVEDDSMAMCKGAYCMMWRNLNNLDNDTRGYCGLAGKPFDD